MTSLRIILFLITLIGTLSCASFFKKKNKYYDYEHPVSGNFSVGLASRPKLVQEEQIEIFGTPYYFNAQYYTSKETFLNGEIRNLEIRSVETGNVVFQKSLIIDIYRTSEKWKHHVFKQKKTIGFGIDIALNIPYHNYKISFDFKIYKEDRLVFDEGKVEVILKRAYYEGYIRKGVGVL